MFKNLKFTNEISTGQIFVAVSLVGSALGVFHTMRSDIELIKQAQTFLSADAERIRGDIRQVRDEVKDLGKEIIRARDKPMRGG